MTEDRPHAAPAQRARRSIPLRTLAIAAAIPIAGFAAMIALRAPDADSRFTIVEGAPEKAGRSTDPLAAELARCRTLPADAVDDRCRAAWEVNHRRFMGESRSLILPEPGQLPESYTPPEPEALPALPKTEGQ